MTPGQREATYLGKGAGPGLRLAAKDRGLKLPGALQSLLGIGVAITALLLPWAILGAFLGLLIG